MRSREELHQLVDRLPADRVEEARKGLTELCDGPAAGFRPLSHDAPTRPIEEILRGLAAEIPQEEWDRLPPDLTDNLDHCAPQR